VHRELIHLFGPIGIQSYGTAIALGLIVFLLLATQSVRRKELLSSSAFFESIVFAGLCALVGGRLLFWLSCMHDYRNLWEFFFVWDGGFSILGSIIAVMLGMTWYLKRTGITLLPYFDLVSLYAPLLQSIARLGCLCAGCCHGCTTTLPWAIAYTDPESFAPLHVPLHPTQIYSSLSLLAIFLILRFLVAPRTQRTGTILWTYLLLEGTERFIIDFWRADRTFASWIPSALSVDQLLALSLSLLGAFFLLKNTFTHASRS
jgi:phosphatidylglycerol:prolipoprotein diacylglycerol transferase